MSGSGALARELTAPAAFAEHRSLVSIPTSLGSQQSIAIVSGVQHALPIDLDNVIHVMYIDRQAHTYKYI